MENATDALKMAFGVLIFVLALSISVNAFSEARQISQTILNYKDREYDYTYVEENKDSSGNVTTERIVSVETIIPTIYRAYKEQYKIIFNFDAIGYTDGLFKEWNATTNSYEPVNYIDATNQTLSGNAQKDEFITDILYGTTDKTKYSGRRLNDQALYDIIKNRKFKESIGIYYPAEQIEDDEDPDQESSVPIANREAKRVITYELIN